MKKLLFLAATILYLSCSDKTTNETKSSSYWQRIKDSFATQNVKEFVINAELEKAYKGYHPVSSKVIDSIIGYGTPYLYSLQDRNKEFTEFTTFVHDDEHGSRIMYLIFDKNDSLRSALQVAAKGGEGGIIYETRSVFLTKDSLLKTTSATTGWDLTKPAPPPRLPKTKGDSSFFYVSILANGAVVEKQYAVKNELNLR